MVDLFFLACGLAMRLSVADAAGIVRAAPAAIGAESFPILQPCAPGFFAARAGIIPRSCCSFGRQCRHEVLPILGVTNFDSIKQFCVTGHLGIAIRTGLANAHALVALLAGL